MGKSMVRRDVARARELEIVRLRVRGFSFDEIADRLGYYDRSGVKRAWDRVMAAQLADQAQDRAAAAQEELARTDWIISSMAPRVEDGDSRAAQVALNAIERRCKLLGLDSPLRVSMDAEQLGSEILGLLTGIAEDNGGDTAT
ncbi:hypothetical protein EYS09_26185 [Streptomyces kasugaensis]|uniref:Uncharacterized protein n=1 Tax=Streptomyces kasugaensis TaxID=1946 RepID=A0A4Q9HPF2_STRKA|nr:hypothetical protein [Streptomyces kasugaensis]TBO56766.1 hypothetical protein EYS09_26185 [Streptomyces kasugaensis]